MKGPESQMKVRQRIARKGAVPEFHQEDIIESGGPYEKGRVLNTIRALLHRFRTWLWKSREFADETRIVLTYDGRTFRQRRGTRVKSRSRLTNTGSDCVSDGESLRHPFGW